ncbi:octaprenyl diphosphate synthase [Burkholderiales bacterium]|nr:octaprenyl diphosphate synthase [Burkholderiales bacterium]
MQITPALPPQAPRARSLPELLAPVADEMRAVDVTIRQRLTSDVALIGAIGDHIIGAGGKRLRPAILLLIARAMGYRGKSHVLLATVIEFIHTATLLHDDVVDESDLRRGRPTSNAAFGNAASVLVGDFLYSRAFQMMVEAGSMRVMQILADATNRIAEGEVLQLLNIHDPTVDETRYLGVVERKTATLFEAAARIGAILANAAPSVEDDCARYGAAIGTAFQIIDDVLDYDGSAQTIGKRVGDDLREGKPTLPVIHALRAASPGQKTQVENAIRDGRGDFTQIAQIVHDNGSIEYARQCARAQCEAAGDAVASLPPSEFRDRLLELTVFAMRRDR